jgi:hypothetical protein
MDSDYEFDAYLLDDATNPVTESDGDEDDGVWDAGAVGRGVVIFNDCVVLLKTQTNSAYRSAPFLN